jgi:hypothetical protein
MILKDLLLTQACLGIKSMQEYFKFIFIIIRA